MTKTDEMINAEYIYQTDTIYKDLLLYPAENGRNISLNALLQGRITNGHTGKPIEDVEISFRDGRHNTLIKKIKTERVTGRYQFNIPVGNLYNINIESEGFVSIENEVIDLSYNCENDTIIKDFVLYPVELG